MTAASPPSGVRSAGRGASPLAGPNRGGAGRPPSLRFPQITQLKRKPLSGQRHAAAPSAETGANADHRRRASCGSRVIAGEKPRGPASGPVPVSMTVALDLSAALLLASALPRLAHAGRGARSGMVPDAAACGRGWMAGRFHAAPVVSTTPPA